MEIINTFFYLYISYFFTCLSLWFKILTFISFGLLMIVYLDRCEISKSKGKNIVSSMLYYLVFSIDVIYRFLANILNYSIKLPGINYCYNRLILVNNSFVKNRNLLFKRLFKTLMVNCLTLDNNKEQIQKTVEKTVFKNETDMMDFLDNIDLDDKKKLRNFNIHNSRKID